MWVECFLTKENCERKTCMIGALYEPNSNTLIWGFSSRSIWSKSVGFPGLYRGKSSIFLWDRDCSGCGVGSVRQPKAGERGWRQSALGCSGVLQSDDSMRASESGVLYDCSSGSTRPGADFSMAPAARMVGIIARMAHLQNVSGMSHSG